MRRGGYSNLILIPLTLDTRKNGNNTLAMEATELGTFTVYLNDVGKDNGGHTTFTKLNFSVRPEKGMAIAWHNLNDDGSPNPENGTRRFKNFERN